MKRASSSADNGARACTKCDQRECYWIKGAEDNPERGGTDGGHDSETGCRDRSGAADGIQRRSHTIKVYAAVTDIVHELLDTRHTFHINNKWLGGDNCDGPAVHLQDQFTPTNQKRGFDR